MLAQQEQKGGYKFIVMAALLGICCFLTYYVHVVVSTDILFTHFFYVPIIVASLWWGRKGLGVAIFLALLLISSHIIIGLESKITYDLIRAAMFIVVALVTGILSERIVIGEKANAIQTKVDTVTPIYNIEEIGKYAECPYCGSNIRETFYELGGIVRCNKCGAFHHRECFDYYGRKCGSQTCKL